MGAWPSGGIDIHAHCVPSQFLEILTERGSTWGISVQTAPSVRVGFSGGFVSGEIDSSLTDMAAKLRRMDDRGIERQVLSGFIDLAASFDHAGVTEYAAAFNSAIAATVEARPDRFAGLATVPTRDADEAAAALHHAITQLGLAGAELPAGEVAGRDLEAFWDVADELSAIVLIHPLASTTSSAPGYLGNYVGNPAESTLAAGRLLVDGVLEHRERMSIVLPHGGGFLPYQLGRFQHGYDTHGAQHGAAWKMPPRDMIRRLYFDTVLDDPGALAYLVSTVGIDHVVLGTDDPFDMAVDRPMEHVQAIPGLDGVAVDKISRGNLADLLDRVNRKPH